MKRNLLNIPIWRWCLLLLLFIGVSFNSYDYVQFYKHMQPIFSETILNATNDFVELCFILPFAWLIIIGDMNIKLNKDKMALSNTFKNFSYVLLINLVIIIIFIITNVISFVLNTGSFVLVKDESSYFTVLLSLLFIFLRFVFLSLIVCLLNGDSNNYRGIIGVIIINLIDWQFYSVFNIKYPMGILPIEHTRIFYTAAMIPQSTGDKRIDISLSFAYWGITIFILAILVFLVINKKIKKRENIIYG